MEPWYTIVIGWLTFIIGHPIIVAAQARAFMESQRTGRRPLLPEWMFNSVDGAIVAAALLLIAIGTVGALNKPRWKIALAIVITTSQFLAVACLWVVIFFAVYCLMGMPVGC